MIDYEQSFAISLQAHGEAVQTSAGELKGVVRIRRELNYLSSKKSSRGGVEIDRDQSSVSFSIADALLLSKGQRVSVRGIDYDLGKSTPFNSHVRFLLIVAQVTNPSQGNWK